MSRHGIARTSLLGAALSIAALAAGTAALTRVRPAALRARLSHHSLAAARNLRGTILLATAGPPMLKLPAAAG